MFRILAFLFLLACLAGGVVWWGSGKLQQYIADGLIEENLVRMAREQLGVEVELGAIHLATFPEVAVERISVKGVSEDVVGLGALRVRLDISDLFSGRLVIDEVRLVRPELELVRGSDGALNVRQLVEQIRNHREALRLAARDEQQIAMDALREDAEALAEDLPPEPVKRRRRPESPPEPPPSVDPLELAMAEEEAERRAELRRREDARNLNQGSLQLRRLVIEKARVRFTDRSLGPEVFRGSLEDLDVTLRLPAAPGQPVDASLEASLLGVPLRASATLDPVHRRGPVHLSLVGLPLGAVQPYLEKRLELPLDLGKIPLHVEGKLDLDGGLSHYELALRIPESRVGVEKAGRSLRATFSLGARLTPDRLHLEGLQVDLQEALGVKLEGSVEDFADPRFEAHLLTTSFDLDPLLALLPAERARKLVALRPKFELGLDAKLRGKLRELVRAEPDVSIQVGPAEASLDLGEEPLVLSLPRFWVRLDEEHLGVSGLELEAAGSKVLEAGLRVENWRELPRIEARLRVPDASLRELLARLPSRLPLKSARAQEALERVLALDPGGSLGVSLGTTLELAALPELPGFRGAETLPQVVELARARQVTLRPQLADPEFLREIRRLGILEIGLGVDLPDFQASLRRGAWEIPLRLALGLRADPDQIRLEQLSVEALGAQLRLRGELTDPLGARSLALGVHLGESQARPLELASVLPHLPLEIQDRIGRFSPRGSLEASASAQGPVTSPHLVANLALREVHAEAETPGGAPAEISLPSLLVRLDGENLALESSDLKLPGGDIELSGSLRDLREERGFGIRVRTLGEGLDLLKLLPYLPTETREKIEARGLERLGLAFSLRGAGTPENPEVTLVSRLLLPTSELRLRAKGANLRTSRDVAAILRTGPGGIRLDKLVERLPPETRAKIRAPVNGALHIQVEGGGSLERPEGLEVRARVDAALPGGKLELRTRLEDPRGERRFVAGIDLSLSRLTELFDFLPEVKRNDLRRLSPAAEVGLSVKAKGTPEDIRANLEASLRHASLRVPLQEKIMPVNLEPVRFQARARIRPREGERPRIALQAGAEAKILARHPDRGLLDLDLGLEGLRYDGADLDLGELSLRILDQPLSVKGLVRDPGGARELDLEAALDLDIPQLVQRLVPPEAEIRSNGKLSLRAEVDGTAVRPEWKADVSLVDFFLDAYKLKGIPLSIEAMKLHATTDDLVLEPFRFSMGGSTNTFFFHGSMLELLRGQREFQDAESFWKALREDREAVVERLGKVAEAKGGKKAVVQMVGNETLLRILGSSSHKLFVHIESKELARPFTFKTLLTGPESKEFEFRQEAIVEKYRQQAMDQVRTRLGTTKRLFGKQRQQIIPIREAYVVVLDRNFNMVYPRKIPFWRLVTTPTKF